MLDVRFYNISMYLFNKNIFEYAEIAPSGLKCTILHIESHSSKYVQNTYPLHVTLMHKIDNCNVYVML